MRKNHLGLLHLRRLYVTPTPHVLEQDCHAPQGPHPPGLMILGVCLASANVVQVSLKQIYEKPPMFNQYIILNKKTKQSHEI